MFRRRYGKDESGDRQELRGTAQGRKEKYLVWGTSVSRKFAEEVNAFLKENGYTKVRLIEAGYKSLKEEAAGNKKDKAE